MTTKPAANKLWNDLRGHLVKAEAAIEAIIDAKAWEPLGYASFAEAWADRMAGVRLATEEMRALVVYAMFADGLTDDEVVTATGYGSQVTKAGASALRRQRSNGVPPSLASTRVRSHLRRKPTEPARVHLEFTPTEYAAFKAAALRHGTTVEAVAAEAVREAFAELGVDA